MSQFLIIQNIKCASVAGIFGCSLMFSSMSMATQCLLDIFLLAEKQDPTLNQALFQSFAAEESWHQGVAKLLPNITVSARSSLDQLNNNRATYQSLGSQNYSTQYIGVNIIQPLFHWDYWVQLDQSTNHIIKNQSDYYAEKQNLIIRVATAYLNILLNQEHLFLAQSEKLSTEQKLKESKARFEVGFSTITQVYEAQAAYDQAIATEIETQNAISSSEGALKQIVGDIDININPLQQDVAPNPPKPNNINDWIAAAEENNLNIISSINATEISRKEIEKQKSANLPTLDLVGNYNYSDVNSTFGLKGDTKSIGLQLNVPLYEGGGANSRLRQVEYEYAIARQRLEGSIREVKKQTRDAFQGVLSNISRLHALETVISSARKALEATEAGLHAGTTSMVELLNVQHNLYKAQNDYAKAKYEYIINFLKLKQASSNLSLDDIKQTNALLKNCH